MKAREEAKKYKKLIREDLYPVLQEVDNVKEAKQFCEILQTVMMSKCNAYWADKNVSDLKLEEELNADAETKDAELYQKAIETLNPLTIVEAQKLLQGMVASLNGYTTNLADSHAMSEIDVDKIVAPD